VHGKLHRKLETLDVYVPSLIGFCLHGWDRLKPTV
jgi:hypothetical protein